VLGNRLERDGISLNGIVLISSVLDFETLLFAPGTICRMSCICPVTPRRPSHITRRSRRRPTWAHSDGSPPLCDGRLRRRALAAGAALPADRKAAVAKQLSLYTGLSEIIWCAEPALNLRQYMAERGAAAGSSRGGWTPRFSGPLPDL
jgi:hypothetical protein